MNPMRRNPQALSALLALSVLASACAREQNHDGSMRIVAAVRNDLGTATVGSVVVTIQQPGASGRGPDDDSSNSIARSQSGSCSSVRPPAIRDSQRARQRL